MAKSPDEAMNIALSANDLARIGFALRQLTGTQSSTEGIAMNRDLIRAHILNCEHHGHRIWCKAIKGPEGENWYEDDECDCSRGKAIAELNSAPSARAVESGPLKLDTDSQVFFYEQDHYYLSNFSAFKVEFNGYTFDTSEAAYHFQRFASDPDGSHHRHAIIFARSAHDAYRYAQENKAHQRPEWDEVKVGVMKDILRAKAEQHEYVRRKLLQTGDRELIENSWRDAFWGWGEDRRGQNMLGRLWAEVRAELRAASTGASRG